jgi:hypothetical protein
MLITSLIFIFIHYLFSITLCILEEKITLLVNAANLSVRAILAAQFVQGNDNLGAAPTQLQTKEALKLDFKRWQERSGVKINKKLMEAFHTHMQTHSLVELNMIQFSECVAQINGMPAADAEKLFKAFDNDNSGNLSLKEITIGFARMMDGDEDERLALAFSAYDVDGSNSLDVEEVIYKYYLPVLNIYNTYIPTIRDVLHFFVFLCMLYRYVDCGDGDADD